MRHILLSRLLLLLLLAAMGACMAAAAQTASGELATYVVVARDGRLHPARMEVPAGQRIKLAIHNEGRGPIEFENLDLRVEKVLAPGANSFVVTPPLRPGTYLFVDEFHPDTAQMHLVAR